MQPIMRPRKLQVFVSSTYTDLREERQAAVEAILTAGHIPAGMELFAAGDESQMSVIKRWIDESDVYLLILGGRYGSIEASSGKSYIHLEYEYAVEQKKPLFAVVIEEGHLEQKVKDHGFKVIEKDHGEKFKVFREIVLTRLVKFWADPRDIKLAVMETLSEFARRPDLVGWVPGTEAVNGGALAEEIARLTKENADLRQRVGASGDQAIFNGLTFSQLYSLLQSEPIREEEVGEAMIVGLRKVAEAFHDKEPSLVHLFWYFRDELVKGMRSMWGQRYLRRLVEYDLAEASSDTADAMGVKITLARIYRLSPVGRQFLIRLMYEKRIAVGSEAVAVNSLVPEATDRD